MIRSRRVNLQKLGTWLSETKFSSPSGHYSLRLLEEKSTERAAIWTEILDFFSEAHEDAKDMVRRVLEPTLSPYIGPQSDPALGYPEDLHVETLLGYFGEVLAGMIAEHKDIHSVGDWRVPAFLFRFHQVAFQKLEERNDLLARGQTVLDVDDEKSTIPGRTGSDVLAFSRNEDGSLAKILVCEAKCLGGHRSNKVRDAHVQLSAPVRCPSGVREIIEILKDYDTEDCRQWREQLLCFRLDLESPVVRVDMFSYAVGNKPTGRNGQISWNANDNPISDYTGNRPLEVVECYLDDPRVLVRQLYSRR